MAVLHAGIAGAGLVGRSLAWKLALAGWRVTLFDASPRDAQDSAAMTAAAMLSPLAELAVSDAEVFALGQRSMELWPQWVQALNAFNAPAGVAPVYYRQKGTVVVAHGPDQSLLAQFAGLLHYKLPPACLPQVRELDAAALAALEPALRDRFQGGLHLQGEGQLSNAQWMDGLALALDRLGVVWHEGLAVDALQAGAIVAGQTTYPVDVAIDARGVGAKPALPQLRGVRGEVLRVECAGVALQRPVRLMHPRYQIYVAPRPDHGFVVGATELESEDTGPVTLRSTLELGSALYSLHPAFGEARILRLSSALRPAMDNDRPVCVQQDGVWHLNGLYRHGYLCAPALVESLLTRLQEAAQ